MDKKRQIEDTEELRRVIAELQAKVDKLEDQEEEVEALEALASQQITDDSYVAYREEESDAYNYPEDEYPESEEYQNEISEDYQEQNNETMEEDQAYDEPDPVSAVRSKKSARKPVNTQEEIIEEEPKPKKKKKNKKGTDDEYIISMEHVTKSYVKGVPALDDINIKIKRGEFVFIVGESGSGKSTLIRLLLHELKPTSGSIMVNGFKVDKLRQYKVPKLRRSMGVVFQDFRLLKDRNVYENVAFAQRIIQVPRREMKKNVPNMLAVVGLASKYRAKPSELSGGEQQRVALARALVNRPPILLADEPTGNLDPKNTEEIMSLLDQINQKGTTVIVVTHNDKIVNDMKKRVITIKNGIVISDEKKGGYLDEDY